MPWTCPCPPCRTRRRRRTRAAAWGWPCGTVRSLVLWLFCWVLMVAWLAVWDGAFSLLVVCMYICFGLYVVFVFVCVPCCFFFWVLAHTHPLSFSPTSTPPQTPHSHPSIPPTPHHPHHKGTLEKEGNLGPYDDEETRAFYEELPDLLNTLPPALLGLTEEEAARLRAENCLEVEEEEEVGGWVGGWSVCIYIYVYIHLLSILRLRVGVCLYICTHTLIIHPLSLYIHSYTCPHTLTNQPPKHPQQEVDLAAAMEVSEEGAEGDEGTMMEGIDDDAAAAELAGDGDGEEEEGEEGEEEDGRPRFSGLKEEGGAAGAASEEGAGGPLSKGHQLTQLLQEALPLCYNRDRADQFVHRFLHLQMGAKARKVREGGRVCVDCTCRWGGEGGSEGGGGRWCGLEEDLPPPFTPRTHSLPPPSTNPQANPSPAPWWPPSTNTNQPIHPSFHLRPFPPSLHQPTPLHQHHLQRLVAALYDVPRQSHELLPQYARIAATLHQALKDVGPALVTELLVGVSLDGRLDT